MKQIAGFLPAVALAFLFISGCATPFTISARNIASDPNDVFKYNNQQARVASARALLHLFGRYDKEKKVWVLHPEVVSVADVKQVVADQLRSLDAFLSYKNIEDADDIDWFPGFRPGLLNQEQIALWIFRRLSYIESYNQFTDYVGELSDELKGEEYSYFFSSGRKSYSIRMLYPMADITKIPFKAMYLENAKHDGTLQLVDTFTVSNVRQFGKRDPDIQDPNEFSWKPENQNWVIRSYKILPDKDKPADNIVQYLEIFRANDKLMTESKPAIKGFAAAGEAAVTVYVIDYDKENSPGWGSPDEVFKSLVNVATGSDLYTQESFRNRLLKPLFESPLNENRPERRKTKPRPIYTEIVKMGDVGVDLWETGAWNVPFEYKNLSQSLDLEFSKAKTPEEMRLEKNEKVKKISMIKQTFKKDFNTVVVVYWAPKKDYSKWNVTYSFTFDTIRLRRKGMQEEVGEVGYFGDKIKAIDYFFGGRWFRIADENGDGVFEKRKLIADPTKGESSTSDGLGESNADMGEDY